VNHTNDWNYTRQQSVVSWCDSDRKPDVGVENEGLPSYEAIKAGLEMLEDGHLNVKSLDIPELTPL